MPVSETIADDASLLLGLTERQPRGGFSEQYAQARAIIGHL